jgi:hypothetical protein
MKAHPTLSVDGIARRRQARWPDEPHNAAPSARNRLMEAQGTFIGSLP